MYMTYEDYYDWYIAKEDELLEEEEFETENQRLYQAAVEFMKKYPVPKMNVEEYYEKNHVQAAWDFVNTNCLGTLRENDNRRKMNPSIDNQEMRHAAEVFCSRFCRH